MSQENKTKQTIIYLDYTAGRGSYDEEYPEENIENSSFSSTKNEKTTEFKPTKVSQANDNRCTFATFYQPQHLSRPQANEFQSLRRHSYNKEKAPGKNNYQQHQNSFGIENNNHYANESVTNKISNSKSHSPEKMVTFNWAPNPIIPKK